MERMANIQCRTKANKGAGMIDIKELRRLAEDSLDPDDDGGNEGWFIESYLELEFGSIAKFMAAASPGTIIALLDHIESLTAKLEDRDNFIIELNEALNEART